MLQDLPLTDQEFEELEAFLQSDATPEECMDIAMLDGFFAALAIGPNTLLPSQWLQEVWGETEDDTMAFDSAEQMQRVLDLVMRYYNERVGDLQEGIDEYEPLIYESRHEGRVVPVIDEWCVGFVRGIELDGEGWAPLLESEEDAALAFPIFLYGTEAGWEKLKENQELQDRHEEIANLIGPTVIGIRDYWLPQRKAASTFRRAEAKTGRNDPCPCGSGKKYKKCCGSPERLH